MRVFLSRVFVASLLVLTLACHAYAVRVMTSPSTAPGDTPLQFDNIALTPDGTTLVVTGQFNPAGGDRVFSMPLPADPSTDTVTLTQLSTGSFSVNSYDVNFAPVISPDGQTILFAHDGNADVTNTIYTMPIAGEGNANFTGFFGSDPNLVLPGDGNHHPIYSGTDVFFLNNNAGFDGAAIPDFLNPASPKPWALSGPDWDRIYKRDSSGVVTAVTAPGDGDIDEGLFKVTPNGASIVYAPDNPIAIRKNRGDIRPKLFTISTAGGTPTEILIPAPNHDFSFSRQLEVTTDGQTVLFIGDYENLGKNELYSVPISGGTPTRISDDLPWSGDVNSFAIAPNGTQVAYIAGQNTSANNELFLTPITGGTGNSIRVSEPPPSNSGEFDVSTTSENRPGGGKIVFSNDSSQIYYLGDLDTNEVNDLYVVDTTEKAGLVPSPYYFVGPSGGSFFDENNWNDQSDGSGNSAPAGSIDPGKRIQHSLIIDGDTVSSGTPANGVGSKASFESGSSLEMTPGSVLNFPESVDELEFLFGSGLKLTDATMIAFEDIFFHGTTILSGGLVESLGDDIEFQDANDTTINGTIIRSAVDNLLFDNSLTSVTGATFESADRFGMRHEVEITLTDSSVDVNGGLGDIEDIFGGPQAEGSTLTLKGASTLLANAIQEGAALVLDGSSVATLLGNPSGGDDLVDPNGTITLMSAGAELIILNASASDVRALVVNGITGMSYLDDPSAWNVTNWDGMSPLASLQLVGVGPAGDFDNDGDVDGADFLVWQRGLGTTFTATDLDVWKANYGTGASSALASAANVPEPASSLLIFVACCVSCIYRQAHKN